MSAHENGTGSSRRRSWKIGLQTYRIYGTAETLRYSCRALRDHGLGETSIHDSLWTNLRAAFHRYESDEVPNATIEISIDGSSTTDRSDKEGYCHGTLPSPEAVSENRWRQLRLSIEGLPYGQIASEFFHNECLVPSESAHFGIISDIDDTVLHTQVGSRWKMAIWSIFRNSYNRLPLPGVARLYRKLAAVDREDDVNPTFYVSSSPWNLYPVLQEFLDAVDLPKGPILLRDLGFGAGSSLAGDHSHKETKIIDILKTYPQLKFILLGDSGQEDAAIYSRVAEHFSDQILCAYIRDTGNVDREMLDAAILKASEAGTELLLVPDSATIEAHARSNGWLV